MTRTLRNPLMRAITDTMWKRDQLQMRAVDALLSFVAPSPRRRAKRQRRRTPKGPR
jgi:hypothetical protein